MAGTGGETAPSGATVEGGASGMHQAVCRGNDLEGAFEKHQWRCQVLVGDSSHTKGGHS